MPGIKITSGTVLGTRIELTVSDEEQAIAIAEAMQQTRKTSSKY